MTATAVATIVFARTTRAERIAYLLDIPAPAPMMARNDEGERMAAK